MTNPDFGARWGRPAIKPVPVAERLPIPRIPEPMNYIAEMRALAAKHQLGFLFNPGGGQFTNASKGVDIQITTENDRGDYHRLIKGLQALGLEAAQQKIRSGPESPLVERVADAIAAQATSAGIVNDRPARAAILEVSKWLAAQSNSVTGQAWAAQLEIEAKG
jgi:hypothetical protein